VVAMEMILETECRKIYQKPSAYLMMTRVKVIILGHLDWVLHLIKTLVKVLPVDLEAAIVELDRFKDLTTQAVILETLILIILHK
jgi:spore maturation protein SpmB